MLQFCLPWPLPVGTGFCLGAACRAEIHFCSDRTDRLVPFLRLTNPLSERAIEGLLAAERGLSLVPSAEVSNSANGFRSRRPLLTDTSVSTASDGEMAWRVAPPLCGRLGRIIIGFMIRQVAAGNNPDTEESDWLAGSIFSPERYARCGPRAPRYAWASAPRSSPEEGGGEIRPHRRPA